MPRSVSKDSGSRMPQPSAWSVFTSSGRSGKLSRSGLREGQWYLFLTATLEASFYGLPYCLIYKVAWPTYLAGRLLVDIEYLGLANILAGRRIVHEFIQHEANVVNISAFLASVMTDQRRWRELERDLLEASAKLGTGGAAEIAAGAIVELLERKDGH